MVNFRSLFACRCRRPPFHFGDYRTDALGEDAHGAEIALSTCKRCVTVWLEYRIEMPHHSRAGRWWRVEVKTEHRREITAATARAFVERQRAGFAGGSFFDSSGHAVSAPIRIV